MHLIDGLSGGRQALVVKTHHAITDGLAGIEIAKMLFDPAPGTHMREPPARSRPTNTTGFARSFSGRGILA